MSETTLANMIESLDYEDRVRIELYIQTMLSSKKGGKDITRSDKKNALQKLSKYYKTLGNQDFDIVREEAMEEKYGRFS